LLAHPISPTEIYIGVFVGSALAMLAAVAGGFGIAGFVAGIRGAAVQPATFVAIAGLAWLLAVAMIGVGMVVSVLAARSATAMGVALVLWLAFVLFGNLGLMGTSVATGMTERTLFFSATANPVEAFRLSAMSTLGGSLDDLGPVGTYAIDRFGDSVGLVTGAVLVLWAVVPVSIGGLLFRRGPER
jgi:Cu-processing system permease protein